MFCPSVPVATQQGWNPFAGSTQTANTPVDPQQAAIDQQALLDQQAAVNQPPQGIQQAWNPFAPSTPTQASPSQASTAQFTKLEFLECPNCKITIEPKVGIPMSNAKCPSCGTTMAHVIRETQVAQDVNTSAGTQVALQQNQAATQSPVQNGLEAETNAQIPILPVLHPILHGAANLSPRNSLPTHVQPDLNNAAGHLSPRHLIPVAGQQGTAQQGTNAGPGMIQQATSGIGTGIIISNKGFILTSSHLVAGYKTLEVVVFTPTGPRAVPGQVVSEATKMDLALIQIDPAGVGIPLTALPMADSSTVRVGDQILAMGNPFGLTQTVSSGIVSSIREKINIQGHILYNVIQTDASINDGNSGGPLINTQGEVIGVNVAVYSPAQTYTGLGFAIPINQAKNSFGIYMDLNATQMSDTTSTPKAFPVATRIGAGARAIGAQPQAAQPQAQPRVTQPQVAQPQAQQAPAVDPNPAPTVWVGIGVQKFNDILSETLKIPVDEGMLINNIYNKSPADLAGLKRGDVLIRIDKKSITNEAALKEFLLQKKAGDKINIDIRRGRIKKTITVKLESGDILAQAMKQSATVDLLKGSEIETGTADIVPLGLTLDNITPDNAFASKLPQGTTGVLISAVEGISFLAGVEEGDILRGVNGISTPTLLSVFKALKSCNLTEGVVLNIERKGVRVDATLRESSKNIPGVV